MADSLASEFSHLVISGEFDSILSLNLKPSKDKAPLFLKRNLSYVDRSHIPSEGYGRNHETIRITLSNHSKNLSNNPQSKQHFIVSTVIREPIDTKGELVYYLPLASKVITVPLDKSEVEVDLPMPNAVWYRKLAILLISHDSLDDVVTLLDGNKEMSNGGKSVTANLAQESIHHWLKPDTQVYHRCFQPLQDKKPPGVYAFTKPLHQGIVKVQYKTEFDGLFSSSASTTKTAHVGAEDSTIPIAQNEEKVIQGPESIDSVAPYPTITFIPTKQAQQDGDEARCKIRCRVAFLPRENANGTSTKQKQQQVEEDQKPKTEKPVSLQYHYCSIDGRFKIDAQQNGYHCPFESCGIKCWGFTGLKHHLQATHHYFDYYFTDNEVWIRPKPGYYDPRLGSFLPQDTSLGSSDITTHTLMPMLFMTPIRIPFMYRCPEKARVLRFAKDAVYPRHEYEEQLEEAAEQEILGYLAENKMNLVGSRIQHTRPVTRPSNNNNAMAVAAAAEVKKKKKRKERPPLPPQNRHRGLALLTPKGQPKFYHSKSCVAMTPDELYGDVDSDDEEEVENWKRRAQQRLFEQPNLCAEQRSFMFSWNMYMKEHPLHADLFMPQQCVDFAKAHLEELRDTDGAFWRCFVAHLHNLWQFRLLLPQHITTVLDVARGGKGGPIVELQALDIGGEEAADTASEPKDGSADVVEKGGG